MNIMEAVKTWRRLRKFCIYVRAGTAGYMYMDAVNIANSAVLKTRFYELAVVV